ncbi:hypothetical protein SLE2022_358000 [Rubroshorea leprosula]
MDSNCRTAARLFSFTILLMLVGIANSDVAQDRADCANQLVGLAPCLPYVGGSSKAPTLDCCTGLKQVLDKSRKCLCILIQDQDDPSLGLKINSTLAATLPSTCHAPVNISDCVSLLHLAPNSKEAKMFEGYEKLTNGQSSPPAAATTGNSTTRTTSAEEKSDGGVKEKKWLGMKMVFGVSLWIFALHLIFDV